MSCNTLLKVQGVLQNRKKHNTELHRSQQKITEIAFKKCASNQLPPKKIYNHYPHLPSLSPTRFIVISLRPAHKHTKDWERKNNFQIFPQHTPMTT
jgi:hypothetical protein